MSSTDGHAVVRLPATTHLGLVRLQVADLERSVAYYQQIIGLAVLERRRSVALLGSRADGTPLVALHEHRDAMAAVEGGQLGLYHFAILLPDRAALGRFLAHLATTHTRAGSADHLVSEAVYLRDPDGLGIEVCADRPRDQWVRTAGEIRMGSLPLDVGTVVLAAGGERWTEIPAGTRIGHVHLHVGNLAEGSRFYHEALGFDRVVWSYRDALFLSAGGYHHHLGLNVWAGADAARPAADDARLLEWELVLPSAADVERLLDRLAAAGHPAREWRVDDPWGTTMRLVDGASAPHSFGV